MRPLRLGVGVWAASLTLALAACGGESVRLVADFFPEYRIEDTFRALAAGDTDEAMVFFADDAVFVDVDGSKYRGAELEDALTFVRPEAGITFVQREKGVQGIGFVAVYRGLGPREGLGWTILFDADVPAAFIESLRVVGGAPSDDPTVLGCVSGGPIPEETMVEASSVAASGAEEAATSLLPLEGGDELMRHGDGWFTVLSGGRAVAFVRTIERDDGWHAKSVWTCER